MPFADAEREVLERQAETRRREWLELERLQMAYNAREFGYVCMYVCMRLLTTSHWLA